MLIDTKFTVVGTGLVGLAACIELLKLNHPTCLIGLPSPELPHPANRVVALNHTSVCYLQELGVWDLIDPHAITHYDYMHLNTTPTEVLQDKLTQLAQGAEVDLEEYCFKLDAQKSAFPGQPLGYIVINSAIEQACWQRIAQLTATQPELLNHCQEKIVKVQQLNRVVGLTTESGKQILSEFVIACDGKNSFVRSQLGVEVQRIDYNQTAITFVLEAAQPHQHACFQSFKPESIIGYLPLDNPNQYSVVFSVTNQVVDFLRNASEQQLLDWVALQSNFHLAGAKLVSRPTFFPLATQFAQQVVGKNFVLMGDAAHAIHPLAGQGVNLGYVDVYDFMGLIRKYPQLDSIVFGNELQAYARTRYFHAHTVANLMRLFQKASAQMDRHTLFKLVPLLQNSPLATTASQELIKAGMGYYEPFYTRFHQTTTNSASDWFTPRTQDAQAHTELQNFIAQSSNPENN